MAFNVTVLKLGEVRQQNRFVVIWLNYLVAAAFALVVWALESGRAPAPLTVGLGATTGFFYAFGLWVSMKAIEKAGLAIQVAGSRMSVLIPLGISMLLFGDVPNLFQGLGILLALAALVVLLSSHRPRKLPLRDSALLWLALAFAVSGAAGTIQKLFTEYGLQGDRPAFVALLFGTAAGLATLPMALRRPRLRAGDVTRGLLFGAGNVTAASLFLKGLSVVPGVVAFPFVSIGVIVLASLSGVLLFQERPGALGYSAISLAAFAILLMNL